MSPFEISDSAAAWIAKGEQEERERLAAEAAREARLRAACRPTLEAKDAWGSTLDHLLSEVDPRIVSTWFRPLVCIGESKGSLCVAASAPACEEVSRRHGALLGRTVRAVSEYRGIFLLRQTDEDLTTEDADLAVG